MLGHESAGALAGTAWRRGGIPAESAVRPGILHDARYGDRSLIHYVLHGRIDRLKPHPWFDAVYYLSQRLDARRTGRNPLEDFFEVGSGEHVSPHPLFDYEAYLRAHPDTQGDALAAFVESGCRGAAPAEGGLFDCNREG